ncbi:IS1380 family transposase [Paenarthrobacter sp. PH39-S1]|uniref:IS1380 family transposase n=1 Tax=Paenarthrobacter sp. PH39-S1 TaxID=3046204 RepID=UPI0024B97641|nr:IS1380 family transposase [Paenarthrobacter sp. PH39-S1]MDJ0358591.1 IS1380 family transposase [Paenarthrobacter sp. PH39-S1]
MAIIRGKKRGRKSAGAKRRARARQVRIGAPDQRLTPAAGVEAVREVDRVLGLTGALDVGIGPVKERARGLSGGELVVSMASAQLAGEDFLVGLDRRRADAAGQELEPVPTPASTTAAGIAKRFGEDQLHGIETGIGTVNTTMMSLLPLVRRTSLLKVATIDGDATDVEVYGRSKEKAAHAYTGALTLRGHIGFWAEAGVPLAAELMGGTEDPRSNAVDMLERAIAALPAGVEKIRCRWDAGYFAAELAAACIERGVEFAIGAKRTGKVMAAAKGLGRYTWVPAVGMDDTEVAIIDYLPGPWPKDAGIVCIARRTRIPADRIPTGRARKRRTIDKNQLALALKGRIDEVYGYSFILTNLDVSTDEKLAEAEFWYRHRTDIEELNRNAKHGTALRHLPSASHAVNSVWMWAGLLGCAVSSWIQEITGLDYGNGRGRRTVARLRRELIRVPARISRRAGIIYLRMPPGPSLLATVLPALQKLPAPG